MTSTVQSIETFLGSLPGFNALSPDALSTLSRQFQPLRYGIGTTLLTTQNLPSHFFVIYQGQVRLLGIDARTQSPATLKLLGPGEPLGWAGLVRQQPCETAIASTDVIALALPAEVFLKLIAKERAISQQYSHQPSLAEVFDVLGHHLASTADGLTDLKDLTLQVEPDALVQIIPKGAFPLNDLSADYRWHLSSGTLNDLSVGDVVEPSHPTHDSPRLSSPIRLLGIPHRSLTLPVALDSLPTQIATLPPALTWETIPEGTEYVTVKPKGGRRSQYPSYTGRGPIDAPLALFRMLAEHLNLPFRKDVIRRILLNQTQPADPPSLELCGAIAEMMGLRAQLVKIPRNVFVKLPTPAITIWQDRLALLYRVDSKQVDFAIPEQGIVRKRTETFLQSGEDTLNVLLLESTQYTPQKRFNLGWFWPAVQQHKVVLLEVLLASFFVQLFALANPLVTQVIIDKVLIQNSISTLHVFGILLVVVAIFEAILTSFRTYLFVDTTNRIDLALGAQVIDHLLRLPLRYFERRPVGELTTRINELENIRQFLTGTALTVVLDAIFSVVYIAVMIFYSWLLTIIALATVPLFAILTLIFAPLLRRLARTKAEYNAHTQSYLVEVLSGIQTVKAQNIELKSRWQWQERYSRYVSAGFNAVITSVTAGSMSNFLNKLSSLLLLWIGAYLVIEQKLTLGELIAFRIIASYTTSPLLRLVQLWQTFQETALSLERLADILDSPQEASAEDRDNIPLPPITGAIRYKDVSFRFAEQGSMQLYNVHWSVEPGQFVGVVGQSGSGKSTLIKLLMRLYDANSGQILIDGYDVQKVELYSLRQQIGLVLQDSLLFEGTVQDNIALTRPDATAEEIVAAAKVAYAHDFIMTLPQGYNTKVGERGSSLSGGQRQRIAIARAVLQNPRLLILDEATSALDYNAERQVVHNLAETFRDRTLLFITHRLKTLQAADAIVMMDAGRIVEQGTHEELLELKGFYYCLYQQQEIMA